MSSLVAQLFHGFQVLGDAIDGDIVIEPVPPGSRAILGCGVGKACLETGRAGLLAIFLWLLVGGLCQWGQCDERQRA